MNKKIIYTIIIILTVSLAIFTIYFVLIGEDTEKPNELSDVDQTDETKNINPKLSQTELKEVIGSIKKECLKTEHDYFCFVYAKDDVSLCYGHEDPNPFFSCENTFYLLNSFDKSNCGGINDESTKLFCDAVIANDISKCDSSTITKKNELSYLCKAVVKEDISFCDNLIGENSSAECINAVWLISALLDSNPLLCDNIVGFQKEHLQNFCKTLIKKETLDCDNLNDQYCETIARLKLVGNMKYDNPEVCLEIDYDESLKLNCFLISEQLKDNPELCSTFIDKELKEKCLVDVNN